MVEMKLLKLRGGKSEIFAKLGQPWPTKLLARHPITKFGHGRLEEVG